jgi:uncharacterized phage-like protein YoqJ
MTPTMRKTINECNDSQKPARKVIVVYIKELVNRHLIEKATEQLNWLYILGRGGSSKSG